MLHTHLENGRCGVSVEAFVEPRKRYPRISQGKVKRSIVGVDALCLAMQFACLPFITATNAHGKRLAMMEGIALGEGDTKAWTYLVVGLMGEIEVELCINQLVEGEVKTHVNGVVGRVEG